MNLKELESAVMENLMHSELKCKSSHDDEKNLKCSVTVVGRKIVSCSGKDFLICQNSYTYNTQAIADTKIMCAKCHKPLRECWRVIPI